MTYLLDANCLIDSHRDFYPLDRVPEFWGWLQYKADQGVLKVPQEIVAELKEGNDALADWVKRADVSRSITLECELDAEIVPRVLDKAYGPNLTDLEIEVIGADPFLIAYAIRDGSAGTVVTREISKPSKERRHRRIPDACRLLGVRCIGLFELIREVDFRTDWRADL